MCVLGHMHATGIWHVEAKGQLEGTDPSFSHMGPGDWTQIIRLGGTCHEVADEGEKKTQHYFCLFVYVCVFMCAHAHSEGHIKANVKFFVFLFPSLCV